MAGEISVEYQNNNTRVIILSLKSVERVRDATTRIREIFGTSHLNYIVTFHEL